MEAMRAARVSVMPPEHVNDVIERIADPQHYDNYRQALEEITGFAPEDKRAKLFAQIMVAGIKAIEGRAQEIWYERHPEDIERRERREDFYADLPYEVNNG